MNAVEIEAAVSDLAAQPFDASEFPYEFLKAFDKKETQLMRLRKGDLNRSDVPGGVLLQSNIHIAVCPPGQTSVTFARLKGSASTLDAKAKFILVTDGIVLEAEDLLTGEAIAPDYPRFAEHIGFFLPLAGISTVREIKDNPIDVRATRRLNKLYVELLRQNPDWGSEARRHDMNHFMARLIFCFFAEDTDIFLSRSLFTNTVEQFSESVGINTHQVLEACFRAMNTKQENRNPDNTPGYAVTFPYVNGGLFAGSTEVPQFTRIARSYLLQAGSLDWKHINPDIFGSMIQAVADDEERGALGMHYTSVPNILKVLNPLFLDELLAQLEAAGDNGRTLLNLRRRLSRIRVFDPACGSGNFLVIAYKELRKIEAEINARRGEHMRPTEISKKNFRGIELRDFAAEIARLALVIAEYQCDVLHRGPLAAKEEFLPLDEMNWITCGNALRLNWLEVCPPEGTGVKLRSDDLFQTPLAQPEIDFENEGGEVFICGNPPYVGDKYQTKDQKEDLKGIAKKDVRAVDYIAGWFWKASDYIRQGDRFAFVSTNSVCQGVQVPLIWPKIIAAGQAIVFCYKDFLWGNNATKNAQVICVIVGVANAEVKPKYIFDGEERKNVDNINFYLTSGKSLIVERANEPISNIAIMFGGNIPRDQGNLLLAPDEAKDLIASYPAAAALIKPILGSKEFINGTDRYCLWITDAQAPLASTIPPINARLSLVREYRLHGSERGLAGLDTPYKFERTIVGNQHTIIIPSVSSERRPYLPCGLLPAHVRISNLALALYDAPLWNMALIASKLHLVWIGTVCGKMKTDFRYSNTLGWNTFPVPTLTEQNKTDLTRCAEDILLAREAHYPDTIAHLYNPETMPANLRAAHDANDEVLERIYIGRRFRNDTERLEKLFAMYANMQRVASRTEQAARKTRVSRKTAEVAD